MWIWSQQPTVICRVKFPRVVRERGAPTGRVVTVYYHINCYWYHYKDLKCHPGHLWSRPNKHFQKVPDWSGSISEQCRSHDTLKVWTIQFCSKYSFGVWVMFIQRWCIGRIHRTLCLRLRLEINILDKNRIYWWSVLDDNLITLHLFFWYILYYKWKINEN